MLSSVIEFNNITKRFGKVEAVKGISFSVQCGEIFGFLGPNGAGKTTTLGILSGLIRASSGDCQVLGQDINKVNQGFYQEIGVVFEEKNLYTRLSGLQNLKFFASLYGVGIVRINELLNEFDLVAAASRPVKGYSKGMKQRLLIARALLNDPQLLILDEPSSGLDPISTDIIYKAIKKFQVEGKTILLSSHQMEEVELLCDRLAFINNGNLAALGSPEELKARYNQETLHDVFLYLTK